MTMTDDNIKTFGVEPPATSPSVLEAASAASPGAARKTMLERVKQAVAARPARKPVTLVVPDLPGFTVRFSPEISVPDLEKWQQWATGDDERTDALQLASYVLIHTCRAILLDGEVITDDEGHTATFSSQSFMSSLNALDAASTVRALYGNDMHIIAVSDKLLAKSGFRADVAEVDPTQP